MKELVEGTKGNPISSEERNLLSVAYKNVVGSLRSAWRVINSIQQKSADKDGTQAKICEEYSQTIKKELDDICADLIVSLKYCVC